MHVHRSPGVMDETPKNQGFCHFKTHEYPILRLIIDKKSLRELCDLGWYYISSDFSWF